MTTQTHTSHMASSAPEGSWLARHRPLVMRIATVGLIGALVLLATAVFAPGLVTFVALMGGCLLMHLFGHGSHSHGAGAAPSER